MSDSTKKVRYEEGHFYYRSPPEGKRCELTALARETKFNVSAIAAALNVSRRQLHRDFIQGVGLSPKDWMKRQRIYMAVRMLDEGRSLADVADDLGYASYDKFHCEVREAVELTPKVYQEARNRIRMERVAPGTASAESGEIG